MVSCSLEEVIGLRSKDEVRAKLRELQKKEMRIKEKMDQLKWILAGDEDEVLVKRKHKKRGPKKKKLKKLIQEDLEEQEEEEDEGYG